MTEKSAKELKVALGKVTGEISSLAKNLKDDSDETDIGKTKQLRELCAAAKELSSLLKEYGSLSDKNQFTVRFIGDGERWAK